MKDLQGKNFLGITDLRGEEIRGLLQLATQLKSSSLSPKSNQVLGLLFYKASTRTRVSFSVAMYQLGGQVIDLNPNSTQVGRGEPISDTARVLDRYLDILAVRTFRQQDLEAFADYAQIPVINALSDLEHPCQVLGDLLTIQECFGSLSGVTLTYLGDGNNVAHSLLLSCALMGMNFRLAAPDVYQPDNSIVQKAKQLAREGTEITLTNEPKAAVRGAQVLYTDVWASMGQEASANSRIPVFQPYQVNEQLLSEAEPEAIVLHCLPAHRGEEITDAAIEGQQSQVWNQAENRMHAQKALLAKLLGIA
ncbi:MAG: ornithine carbamoyltransferase [Cyanobacteria bacterium SW_4_48_29]|nr:MAG: ornithine carbamoyltransferase [Cyanobacteria bacterium QH_2_48_84]PSO66912.1 MAG: ornithine carbamoyltransferase [Cyanobacteria bacterium QH_7_48_89]PSO71045.1 MAG: ornithine carbamoyltransferase [Cyanobacteria bacterium QS_1_48_34]PSO74376.1 MAG: ornithine carbamoyltransferase [Cyanobacteria bacterium QH_3_48_40]PSO91337.1 MAG: ornithine carbamoyltransferase [Cyanobacteria bacterium QS_9_48_30]PSO94847.1 MAG: ornithine carbamoyltransferase [Cyanobacteria bacterium QS_6_48_18]PSO9993